MIQTIDSLEFLTSKCEKEVDIIFCDPPYALGSEVTIRQDGKVDYVKAVDFMNKWDMPTGEYWEKWFQEAYRVLKYGGYCIMYGMDRQLLIFKYYASLAGFQEQQSLYWFYVSGFPKASDLSKMIDSHKILGTANTTQFKHLKGDLVDKAGIGFSKNNEASGYRPADYNKTSPKSIINFQPQHNLAKKYEGYKYSVAPLKQTNETIMVFQKPYKTGSCLHDTLAYENGDKECSCGALNIDGCRVVTSDDLRGGSCGGMFAQRNEDGTLKKAIGSGDKGRYPSQTFIDSQASEIIDMQSGDLVGHDHIRHSTREPKETSIGFTSYGVYESNGDKDTGGASKILHKCDYEIGEYDLYMYCPKVSRGERNAGCENRECETVVRQGLAGEKNNPTHFNAHPCLKPISLNEQILKLFKTPNEQFILYPFAGAGSEIIGGIRAGFENWEGCELSEEYTEIAKARIEWWSNRYEMVGDKKVWIRDLPKCEEVIDDELQMSMFDMWEE